jgi:hypothetical protein
MKIKYKKTKKYQAQLEFNRASMYLFSIFAGRR